MPRLDLLPGPPLKAVSPAQHLFVRARLGGMGKALRVLGFAAALGLISVDAAAAPKVHVVSSGQRLGSIAKRYNVSIEELCRANGIRRNAPIRPGQKLVIPGLDTPAETKSSPKTGASAPASAPAPASSSRNEPTTSEAKAPRRPAAGAEVPKVHVVASGQTLGGIARRYSVSIDALCRASGISRRSKLRVGQRLVVPTQDDETGERAATYRVTGRLDRAQPARGSGRISHKSYARTPSRRGYLTLVRYDRTWSGQVVGQRSGALLPKARATVSALLGADAGGPQMDGRLLQLLVRVSDHFGGRPVRVVSGMRENSYFHDSKHPLGRALDFSIPGVPNEVVRDYCRTLGAVGVGYYPNSSFVHLDVRDRPTYWVDYAGPGEPPRSTPWRVAARPAAPSPEDSASADAATQALAPAPQAPQALSTATATEAQPAPVADAAEPPADPSVESPSAPAADR